MFSCGPYESTSDNDIQNIININSCNSGGTIETTDSAGNSNTEYYSNPTYTNTNSNSNYVLANCAEISIVDISNYDISTSQVVSISNEIFPGTIINAELSNNLVIIPPLFDVCLNLPIILNLFIRQ
jgi:hypothetical protein